ncbi:hypothetical protein FKM82_028284 [Ascaphus truei]
MTVCVFLESFYTEARISCLCELGGIRYFYGTRSWGQNGSDKKIYKYLFFFLSLYKYVHGLMYSELPSGWGLLKTVHEGWGGSRRILETLPLRMRWSGIYRRRSQEESVQGEGGGG